MQAFNDVPDSSRCNVKLSSDISQRLTRIMKRSNCPYLRPLQLGSTVTLLARARLDMDVIARTFSFCLAILSISISHIIRMRALKKMVDPNAAWVVTSVANKHLWRYRPIGYNPSKPMCKKETSFPFYCDTDFPVSIPVFAPRPYPTIASCVDVLPKSIDEFRHAPNMTQILCEVQA